MIFAGDGRGGFIVPEFAPTVDGLAVFLRLLGLVARTRLSLSQIDARIPEVKLLRRTVPTPWAAKGAVMRPQFQAINARVLTIILLVALPVLVIGAAIVVSIGQSRLHETQSTRLSQLAEYTAGAVDAYVFRRILDASLLGRVPDVRRVAESGNTAPFDAARARENVQVR